MQSTLVWIVLVLGLSTLCGGTASAESWDFEDADVGKLPPGWTSAKTGEGEGSVWKVVEDKSAPAGARVLAIAGKIDQGGGVVWRYSDASNYYIARFNPLDDNVRLYMVVDGKRMQLATKEGLEGPAGEWQTLAVRMKGDSIECSLNGKKHLAANRWSSATCTSTHSTSITRIASRNT